MQEGNEVCRWEEGVEGCGEVLGAGMLNRILGREVRDKHGKYGTVKRVTSKATTFGGEIGRRAKAHKG